MPYLILVGMMGSGKTTVGREAAARLGVEFEDTDKMLEARLGRPIHQLFQLYGEEAFREHETRILEGLEPKNGILATGGGIVLKDENWTQLRRLGRSVFLDAGLALLQSRLARAVKRRPLLESEDWEEKLANIRTSRLGRYQLADHVLKLEEEEDIAAVTERIKELAPWT